MTDAEQIAALAADLQRVIDRYRAEFHLTLAAAIGTLEVVKLELWKDQTNAQNAAARNFTDLCPTIGESVASIADTKLKNA
jgi:hypothetical protein